MLISNSMPIATLDDKTFSLFNRQQNKIQQQLSKQHHTLQKLSVGLTRVSLDSQHYAGDLFYLAQQLDKVNSGLSKKLQLLKQLAGFKSVAGTEGISAAHNSLFSSMKLQATMMQRQEITINPVVVEVPSPPEVIVIPAPPPEVIIVELPAPVCECKPQPINNITINQHQVLQPPPMAVYQPDRAKPGGKESSHLENIFVNTSSKVGGWLGGILFRSLGRRIPGGRNRFSQFMLERLGESSGEELFGWGAKKIAGWFSADKAETKPADNLSLMPVAPAFYQNQQSSSIIIDQAGVRIDTNQLQQVTQPVIDAAQQYQQQENSTEPGLMESVGSVAGDLAGGWLGAKAGAAIGTMILPGIGTAIGGALGYVAGAEVGSWLFGKVGSLFDSEPEPPPSLPVTNGQPYGAAVNQQSSRLLIDQDTGSIEIITDQLQQITQPAPMAVYQPDKVLQQQDDPSHLKNIFVNTSAKVGGWLGGKLFKGLGYLIPGGKNRFSQFMLEQMGEASGEELFGWGAEKIAGWFSSDDAEGQSVGQPSLAAVAPALYRNKQSSHIRVDNGRVEVSSDQLQQISQPPLAAVYQSGGQGIGNQPGTASGFAIAGDIAGGFAGAKAGAAIGSLILPGIGTVAGGLIGGMIGGGVGSWLFSKVGSLFEPDQSEVSEFTGGGGRSSGGGRSGGGGASSVWHTSDATSEASQILLEQLDACYEKHELLNEQSQTILIEPQQIAKQLEAQISDQTRSPLTDNPISQCQDNRQIIFNPTITINSEGLDKDQASALADSILLRLRAEFNDLLGSNDLSVRLDASLYDGAC